MTAAGPQAGQFSPTVVLTDLGLTDLVELDVGLVKLHSHAFTEKADLPKADFFWNNAVAS